MLHIVKHKKCLINFKLLDWPSFWQSVRMGVFLQKMGLLHMGQKIEDQTDFEKIYKNGEYFLTQKSFHYVLIFFVQTLLQQNLLIMTVSLWCW